MAAEDVDETGGVDVAARQHDRHVPSKRCDPSGKSAAVPTAPAPSAIRCSAATAGNPRELVLATLRYRRRHVERWRADGVGVGISRRAVGCVGPGVISRGGPPEAGLWRAGRVHSTPTTHPVQMAPRCLPLIVRAADPELSVPRQGVLEDRSATVPAPAMTSASLCGEMNAARVRRRSPWPSARLRRSRVPRTQRRPVAADRVDFVVGASIGVNTVGGTPGSRRRWPRCAP
jgi:hypothetical protein